MTFFLAAILILLVVLVAVAVPTLLQLRATLASAQSVLDATGPRLNRALDEVTAAAARIQHVATQVEDRVEQAREILRSTTAIVAQVGRIRDSVRTAAAIGSAVGPAFAAAVRAFFARSEGPDADAATGRSAVVDPATAEDRAPTHG